MPSSTRLQMKRNESVRTWCARSSSCTEPPSIDYVPTCVGSVSETIGKARLHIRECDVRCAFREMHGQTPPRLQRRR